MKKVAENPNRRVGSRELKTRLGEYLKMVRSGKTWIVTVRGEPVAELRPLRLHGESDLQARFRRMAAEGHITLGSFEGLAPVKPVASVDEAHTLSDAVTEDREQPF